MKQLILIASCACLVPVFAAPNPCSDPIFGYNVVKNSIYPFTVGSSSACFFAYYTPNPDPKADAKGNGNRGDSLWYAYYKTNKPEKIYEFPKPDDNYWSKVCNLHAVSFQPMYKGKGRNVTIIGACDDYNSVNYNVPLVFSWEWHKFVLDEKIYKNLSGFIGLTVGDIQAFINSPYVQYMYLKDRYQLTYHKNK